MTIIVLILPSGAEEWVALVCPVDGEWELLVRILLRFIQFSFKKRYNTPKKSARKLLKPDIWDPETLVLSMSKASNTSKSDFLTEMIF